MAEPCALWVLLLRKFALGKLSAIEVQELAAAAVKSGLDRTEIRELQSLGAMGHQPGNAHRDMLRKHFAVLASPEPWKVKCDLVLKEDGKPVEKELETAVMLPHLCEQHKIRSVHIDHMIARLLCADECKVGAQISLRQKTVKKLYQCVKST